jgi:sigma-B regulation protein RsbU (phosphoserine phosphatase)
VGEWLAPPVILAFSHAKDDPVTRVRSIRIKLAGALLSVLLPLIALDVVHCWHRWAADGPFVRDLIELALASLLMAVVALFLGARLSRPIERLLAAARALGAGEPLPALSRDTGDELAELTGTFQDMAVRIRQRETQLRALVDTGQRLNAELDLEKVCRAVVEQACGMFHATTANVMLYDAGTSRLEVVAHHGAGAELFAHRRPGEGVIGRAFQSREPLLIPDVASDPAVADGPSLAKLGIRSLLAIPLLAKGKAIGVLSLCMPACTAAAPAASEDLEALGLLATQAAVAIDNARLHEAVEAERARLDAVIESMPAGVCFTGAEHGQIILANAVAARFLEPASVTRPEHLALGSEEISLPEAHGASPQTADRRDDAEDWDGVTLIHTVLREAPRRRLEARVRQGAGKSVPLLVNSTPTRDRQGQVTGAVAVFQDITPFKESQARLEAALAKERHVAELLQTSFLPEALPLLPGLEWGNIYRAALQEARIGGDFYDAVDLGDGRVALAIGDVSGKGVAAAVYTALAKYSWRAYIAEDPQPGPVMVRLNRTLHRYVEPELFVTMFYGLLDTRARRLTYVSAGHLPALVYRAALGTCEELETRGLLLGIVPSAPYEERTVPLGTGDLLLLYTDGIVEIRRDGRICDEELLAHWLRKHVHRPAPELVAAIYQEAYDFSQETLEDDVALLAARLTSLAACGTTA